MTKIFFISIFLLNIVKILLTNKVIKVNDTNYEEYIINNDYVAIYFHATWSSDSHTLRQQFFGLPHSVSTDQKVAYLETTSKDYRINYKFDIKRYPTMIMVNKEKHFIYNGQMKVRDMAEWIEKKILKKINELSDLNEIEKIFEKNDVFILYIGENLNNEANTNKIENDYYSEFLKASENYGEILFLKITNRSIIEKLNIKEEYRNLSPKILIFKTYDDNLNIYSPKNLGDFNEDKIEHFIRSFSQPAIKAFNPINHMYVVNNKNEFTVLIVNSNKTIDFNEDIYSTDGLQLYKEFYNEAMQYRGKITFMLANYTDISQTTISQDFDISLADLPILIINGYNSGKTKIERFKSTKEDLDNLADFYNKYKYKALPRFLKSEELPANQFIHTNVYKLVRKNFFNLVVDSDKHFLIYLVRRNCGLCTEVEFFKFSFFNILI